jgi:hypothetical protein
MSRRISRPWVAAVVVFLGAATWGLLEPEGPAAGSPSQAVAARGVGGDPDLLPKKKEKPKGPGPKMPGGRQIGGTVLQGFPAAKANPKQIATSETAWKIEWTITNPQNALPGKKRPPSSVLAIPSAQFMYKDRTGKPRWITVARNITVGEVFVPYDPFRPVFQDVQSFSFWILPAKKEYLGPACVLPGEILTSKVPAMSGRVLKEVHDDGVRWIGRGDRARRGEKMTLWALFNGANYRYIMEYGFRDDGVIHCRVGATAHNFHKYRQDQGDVHLHAGCWHWDMDLGDPQDPNNGGADKNVVRLVRRVPKERPGLFRVAVDPFPNGPQAAAGGGQACEGFANWKAEEFTILRVESTVRKNSNDRPTAYDVMPVRMGSVRNYPTAKRPGFGAYEYMNHDFWVTRTEAKQTSFRQLPGYAAGRRPIDLQPVTIWHNAPLWHVPRAEDFGPDGVNNGQGVAITSWAEVLMRPRNLFDSTPLYTP